MSTCSVQMGGRRKSYRRKMKHSRKHSRRNRHKHRGGEGEVMEQSEMSPSPMEAPAPTSAPASEPANPTWEDRKRQIGETHGKVMAGLSSAGQSFGNFTSSIGNSVKGFGSNVQDKWNSMTNSSSTSNATPSVASPPAPMTGGARHRKKTKTMRKHKRARRNKHRRSRRKRH